MMSDIDNCSVGSALIAEGVYDLECGTVGEDLVGAIWVDGLERPLDEDG